MRRFLLGLLISGSAVAANAHPAWGIVVDRSGQVYFSDLETVWRIDTRGNLSIARPGVSGHHVHELAIDDAGNVYGPDYSGGEVLMTGLWRMDPQGRVTNVTLPSIWRDRGGNAYWVEENNHTKVRTEIIKRTPAGQNVVLAGSRYGHADGRGVTAQFREIYAMTFGPDSALYVTDLWSIRRITLSGEVTTVAGNLQSPAADSLTYGALMGLDVSRTGDIYVADFRDRRVLRVNRRGSASVVLRSEPPWTPAGVAIGPAGEIYVMEIGFEPPRTWIPPRVRKISPDGKVTTVATCPRPLAPRSGERVPRSGG